MVFYVVFSYDRSNVFIRSCYDIRRDISDKNAHIHRSAKLYSGGGIFIITVAINIYFEGWFKNLYLIIPLSIMLVFKTFTTEDLVPMLFQIICLYGSLFILIFLEIMMKTNRRETV